MKPDWAANLTEGDGLMIKGCHLSRGGQWGYVVRDGVTKEGCSLDFYCDVFGDPSGLPTIEFWEWAEIEPPPSTARHQDATPTPFSCPVNSAKP